MSGVILAFPGRGGGSCSILPLPPACLILPPSSCLPHFHHPLVCLTSHYVVCFRLLCSLYFSYLIISLLPFFLSHHYVFLSLFSLIYLSALFNSSYSSTHHFKLSLYFYLPLYSPFRTFVFFCTPSLGLSYLSSLPSLLLLL